ncbi:MAG: DUF1461 domain-containing protein [Akkermansiaceae bacterium]
MKEIKGKRWMIPFYGLALVLLLVLGSVLVVSHPVVWEKVHRSAMGDKLKEVHYEDANRITGGLWTEEPYQEISDSLKYRKMNSKEVAHYEDVRELLGTARVVLGVSFVVILVGCVLVGWRRVWGSGFASFVLLGMVAGVWMMIHWHSLFKALHWVIFMDDSWKLPNKSYSLGLFPHKVWQLAGGVIGLLVLVPLLIPIFIRKREK